MLAIDASIPSKVIPSPDDIEVIVVQINTSNPCTLCLVYNPPNSTATYQQNLLNFLSVTMQTYDNLIILGDFNTADISWSSLSADSNFSTSLCDLVFQYNYSQLVDLPTHSHGNILDLILTSSEDLITDITVNNTSNCILNSDHHMIYFNIRLTNFNDHTRKESFYIRDYSRGDYDSLNMYLCNTDFSDCYNFNDVELAWSFIKSVILFAIEQCVPTIKIGPHQQPRWFTPTLRHHIKCVRTLRKKYLRSPTERNKTQLHAAEVNLSNEFIQAKTTYESNLIHNFASTNDSKIYQYIRNLTNSHLIPTTIHLDNLSAHDDFGKATLFNQYFHSVFTISSMDLPTDINTIDSSVDNHLISISISEGEVLEVLNSLDPHKSTGIDGIGPKILKHCALFLFKPLHFLYTLSLQKHILPTDWRIHSIVPIFKSGDKSLANNYRPISLLCNISKVMERLVYNKIISHISSHISPHQFGFLNNRSTLQQLLILFNHIVNEKDQTDVIYLDLRKAFDSVPHNELLLKLRSMGISGNLWLWFKSYLLNRQQCVKINNVHSHLLPVKSGIPQGSILGPLLFLIYINDIPDCAVSSIILLFADDTKCFKTVGDQLDSDQLQQDIDSLYKWTHDWNLTFNLNKCIHISFRSKIQTTYNIGASTITRANTHRDLGILVSILGATLPVNHS